MTASKRALKRQQAQTYRMRVLAVINGSNAFLTGRELSILSQLTYRQTIDALNALNNAEKIARTGRKSTARWGKLPTRPENPAAALESVFRGFFS